MINTGFLFAWLELSAGEDVASCWSVELWRRLIEGYQWRFCCPLRRNPSLDVPTFFQFRDSGTYNPDKGTYVHGNALAMHGDKRISTRTIITNRVRTSS